MTAYRDILRVVPTLQSAALASDSYAFLKSKKKKKASSFLRQGTKTIVGSALIKETASVIVSRRFKIKSTVCKNTNKIKVCL